MDALLRPLASGNIEAIILARNAPAWTFSFNLTFSSSFRVLSRTPFTHQLPLNVEYFESSDTPRYQSYQDSKYGNGLALGSQVMPAFTVTTETSTILEFALQNEGQQPTASTSKIGLDASSYQLTDDIYDLRMFQESMNNKITPFQERNHHCSKHPQALNPRVTGESFSHLFA